MNSFSDFDKVKMVATAVRKGLVDLVKSGEVRYYGLDLGGLCGQASVQIYEICKKLGIDDIELHMAPGHMFNVFRGKIVDVMATQFNKRRKGVYIIKYSYGRKKYFHYRTDKISRDYKDTWGFYNGVDFNRNRKYIRKHLNEQILRIIDKKNF